jgi:cysteine desulfurase
MVLMSVLSEEDLEHSTPVRVSFSHFTKKSDIDAFVNALEEIGKQFIIEKADSLHR